MKEKTCTFSEHFDQIFNLKRKILLFNEFLMFWGFQNCPWCDFYHVWISFNLIFVICFLVKSCKLKYSWFWHLTLGWLCWALHWLLIKVSVRYQNRPCLGRDWVIGHQYLRRFRSNNRVLQNNAIYGRRCS